MSRFNYKITSDNKARIVRRLEQENIAYWEIAQVLGCHENTVARMVRRASEDDTERIFNAIDELSATYRMRLKLSSKVKL